MRFIRKVRLTGVRLRLLVGFALVALITGLMTAGIIAATWKISPRRE